MVLFVRSSTTVPVREVRNPSVREQRKFIQWIPFLLALCSRSSGRRCYGLAGEQHEASSGHEPPRNRPRHTPFSAQLCSQLIFVKPNA
ncbi:hypothetical protein EXIGLDRAFT_336249 [Exidia glandulosa HHB12029]|uniref:Uncharacterized protein n=1 Tax=Exidia glandulosa HHB12029 TaxID=1314781 RepID=A0A165CLH8_EXIGL|nr:hypothetical protein EXIGLDRAFT_336249 [Exidia glandulosa HHB12029]